MASASAKKSVVAAEQNVPVVAAEAKSKPGLRAWLRSWKQVVMAELLNLLEHRRYNIKSDRKLP